MSDFLKHIWLQKAMLKEQKICNRQNQDYQQDNNSISIVGSTIYFFLSYPEKYWPYQTQRLLIQSQPTVTAEYTVKEIILIHCKTHKTTDASLLDREDLFLVQKAEV